MNLDLTPTLAVVSGPFPLERYEALVERLRYRPKGYAFDPRFKFHKWDGWQALYFPTRDGRLVFPAGLRPHVRDLLADVPVTSAPPRLPPAFPTLDRLPDGLVLRPAQVEAIRVAVAEQQGLLDLAPNFGKTEVMAGICACFPRERVLVLVDSARLVQQDAERLRLRLREPVRVLGAADATARVTVATVQMIHQRLQRPAMEAWLATQPVVLVDEAHRITGPRPGQTGQWWPVLGRLTHAVVRLGLSGSLSDMETRVTAEAYLGPVLMTVTDKELIDAGHSADPIIVMPYIGTWAHDPNYADAYEDGIARNVNRNLVLARDWMVWCAARRLKTLALVYRKPHGRALVRAAESFGLRARAIDGDTPQDEITAALDASRTGALDVLIASTIANTGWDLPWLDVLINAAAWKSPVATKQKLGRILRVNPERPGAHPVVIDPFDLGHDLLKRHARSRFRLYRRKQFLVYEGSPEEMRTHLDRLYPVP